MVKGGSTVVVSRWRRRWRGLLVQLLIMAAWLVAYRYLIRPLMPSGNIMGIAILIVLSLSILAVPIGAAVYRRKRRGAADEDAVGDQDRP